MAVQDRVEARFQAGTRRAMSEMIGLHDSSVPNHGAELVRVLHGHTSSLVDTTEDDPVLYAYVILDHAENMTGLIAAARQWAYEQTEATPNRVRENGAQPCR